MEYWNKRKFKFSQVTEELAYILGVYFGDGSVLRDPKTGVGKYFTVSAIDRDFIEKVKSCCVTLFPNLKDKKIRVQLDGIQNQRNTVYHFKFGSADFCSWILDITKNKTVIPNIIPHTQNAVTKAFCEGYLDSEAWVFKGTRWANGHSHYESGVGSTSLIVKDVVSLLELHGVRHGKWCFPKTQVGNTFYRCTLNMSSLYYSNIHFSIQRKQQNITDYAIERDLQRLYAGAARFFKRGKTQSDLHGNMENTAEMSVSPSSR